MNRTATSLLLAIAAMTGIPPKVVAQEPAAGAAQSPNAADLAAIVAELQRRELAAKTVELLLATEGHPPGGLAFTTRGSLRVLRGEQGAVTAVQAAVDYSFGDGLSGHMDSVKTPDGVLIFEQNPAYGEVFVRIDKAIVADIEWAGVILQRSDLPGLGDARAAAPLGSAMVADLAQRYQLAELPGRKDRSGQLGAWYGGDRKPGPGLEGEDPDLPLADRVEVFLREGDRALLEVVYLQGGKALQRIAVEKLVVDGPMPLESFKLEDKGKRPQDVKAYAPMWQQIEDLLQRAAVRAAELAEKGQLKAPENVPPSKRQ